MRTKVGALLLAISIVIPFVVDRPCDRRAPLDEATFTAITRDCAQLARAGFSRNGCVALVLDQPQPQRLMFALGQ